MLAVQNENVLSNENQNIQPKTCEYKGLTYFVLNDMNGKCFINVDGKKKYLDKNGCVCNKQKGTKGACMKKIVIIVAIIVCTLSLNKNYELNKNNTIRFKWKNNKSMG